MKFSKKAVIALSCAVAGACLFAQTQTTDKNTSNSSDKKSETSVENEYLNDADGTVILTLANSDEYDNKLVAMQYLQNAVDNGNTSDEVVAALDQLAGEGISTQNRKNGRLVNNYPDIRRQACILMAKIPTEHSKNSLMQIAIAENEPMVIAAAVNSLGEIGMNNNDEVVDVIAFANKRNEVLNPTSSMALEVVNALDKLSDSTSNKRLITDTLANIASDYHYVSPVRKRALEVLKKLGSSSSSKSDNKSTKTDSSKSNTTKQDTAASSTKAAE